MRPASWKLVSACILAASATFLSGCHLGPVAKPIPVFAREDASLGSFYWVDQADCVSLLRKVEAFTIIKGDVSDLDLRIERGLMVHPWQCPSTTVPGATILVREKRPVLVPTLVTISFVVHYLTKDGYTTTSSHTRRLLLEPRRRTTK